MQHTILRGARNLLWILPNTVYSSFSHSKTQHHREHIHYGTFLFLVKNSYTVSTAGSQAYLEPKPSFHCYKIFPRIWKANLPEPANLVFSKKMPAEPESLYLTMVLGLLYLLEIPFSWPAAWKSLYFSLWDASSCPITVHNDLGAESKVMLYFSVAVSRIWGSIYLYFQALSLQSHFPVPWRSSWTYSWHVQIQRSNEILNLQYLSMKENKSSI